jgi:hypothetical protein
MGGEKWPGHDTEPRCGLPRLPMSLVAPFCRCGSVRYDGVNAIGQRTRSAASGLTVSRGHARRRGRSGVHRSQQGRVTPDEAKRRVHALRNVSNIDQLNQ